MKNKDDPKTLEEAQIKVEELHTKMNEISEFYLLTQAEFIDAVTERNRLREKANGTTQQNRH
jgi:hypothetical protein